MCFHCGKKRKRKGSKRKEGKGKEVDLSMGFLCTGVPGVDAPTCPSRVPSSRRMVRYHHHHHHHHYHHHHHHHHHRRRRRRRRRHHHHTTATTATATDLSDSPAACYCASTQPLQVHTYDGGDLVKTLNGIFGYAHACGFEV